MKKFYITKEYLDSKGIKYITGCDPVTFMNNQSLYATSFNFDNESEFLNSDLIKNTKAMNSYLFFWDVNPNLDLEGIFKDLEWTTNIDEAEQINIKLYTNNMHNFLKG